MPEALPTWIRLQSRTLPKSMVSVVETAKVAVILAPGGDRDASTLATDTSTLRTVPSTQLTTNRQAAACNQCDGTILPLQRVPACRPNPSGDGTTECTMSNRPGQVAVEGATRVGRVDAVIANVLLRPSGFRQAFETTPGPVRRIKSSHGA
jgi:hypothetical protein